MTAMFTYFPSFLQIPYKNEDPYILYVYLLVTSHVILYNLGNLCGEKVPQGQVSVFHHVSLFWSDTVALAVTGRQSSQLC